MFKGGTPKSTPLFMVSGKPVSSTAYVVFNKIVSTSKEGVGFVITLILLSTGAKTTSGS